MKKSLRFCVLLALAAALLTVSAFADTGPKAQLKVLVKNAPEEPYYLDLLEKGDYQGHTYGSGDGDDTYSGRTAGGGAGRLARLHRAGHQRCTHVGRPDRQ